MRVSIYSGEKNLSEIADRLYKDINTRVRSKIEESVLKANPQLSSLESLPAGTPILVPDIAGIEPADETVPVVKMDTDLIIDVQRNIDDARKTLVIAAEHRVEVASDALDKASQQLKDTAATTERKEMVKRMVKEAEEDVKEAKKFEAWLRVALAQMEKDLEQMVQTMTRLSARATRVREPMPPESALSGSTTEKGRGSEEIPGIRIPRKLVRKIPKIKKRKG